MAFVEITDDVGFLVEPDESTIVKEIVFPVADEDLAEIGDQDAFALAAAFGEAALVESVAVLDEAVGVLEGVVHGGWRGFILLVIIVGGGEMGWDRG